MKRAEIQSVEEDRRDGLEEFEGMKLMLDLLSRVAAFPVETRSKDSSGCSAVGLTTADP